MSDDKRKGAVSLSLHPVGLSDFEMANTLPTCRLLHSPTTTNNEVKGFQTHHQASSFTLHKSSSFPGCYKYCKTPLLLTSSAASNFKTSAQKKTTTTTTLIPDPDYRIPVVLLGLAGGLAYQDNLLAAAPVGLLGLLLLFQTTRVRFVFDREALEVKVGDQLQEGGENVFVGGKNRWKYSTFVNWELWWPNFPVLVYFKETQTKPEGQVHFFPVIFNGKQLYNAMVERAGPSKTSGPKQ